MIAFLSSSHCVYLGLYLDYAYPSLPTLVRQRYIALFVSILSGESKELDHYDESSGVQR